MGLSELGEGNLSKDTMIDGGMFQTELGRRRVTD